MSPCRSRPLEAQWPDLLGDLCQTSKGWKQLDDSDIIMCICLQAPTTVPDEMKLK